MMMGDRIVERALNKPVYNKGYEETLFTEEEEIFSANIRKFGVTLLVSWV